MADLIPTLLSAALSRASTGWPVFPCHPRTKRPLVAHGFKEASLDPNQIADWWRRWPKAMIGVPTGTPIGAFVIDIDAGTDADTGEIFEAAKLLQNFQDSIGLILPKTCVAWTPRGGRHFYFAIPANQKIQSRTAFIARVDVRGDGGYVIVPPSERSDGVRYLWEVSPEVMAPATAPLQLVEAIVRRGRSTTLAESKPWVFPADQVRGRSSSKAAYRQSVLSSEARSVAVASPGQRNARLNQAAFRLGRLVVNDELTEDDVVSTLEAAAADCGLVGDDGIASVRGTIASGFHAGLKQPRTISNDRPNATSAANRRHDDLGASERPLDRQLAKFEHTDRGNAKRFEKRNKGRLLFSGAHGWLWWDDQRWQRDERELAVRRAVHNTVEALFREADAIQSSSIDDEDMEE